MATFIERHKIWLLPLLGAGVVAVVILNLRSGTAPAPPAEPPVQAEPAAAAPPAEPHASSAAADLWADLKSLETVPPSLAQGGALALRAHGALGTALVPPAMPDLAQPTLPAAEARRNPPGPAPEASAPVEPPPPPEPDFLFQGPRGRRVWIEGRPLAEGQSVPEGPYRVGRIGRSRVELIGPQGSTTQSTVFPRPLPKSPVETP